MSLRKFILNMASNVSLVNRRPFNVIVEGNIGSGKTSFLKYFNKYNNVCVLAEPINMWRNCNGHNLFGLMYDDPKKWSFSFQSYVQLTMLQLHKKRTQHSVKLMERSIYSARYCFVETMLKDGLLPPPSYAVIDEWFKWVCSNADIKVDLIVYLRTTPEVVYERMMKRNRAEEKSVSLEYLQKLHKVHENWLYYKTEHSCPAPVFTVNANLDKSVIVDEYERCQPHILNKFAIQAQA